ncbi:MAG TPA: hypothetical protein VN673_03415 [Clostridia bacterium]|nr:hypothetical protein [Clostridia bacterium]
MQKSTQPALKVNSLPQWLESELANPPIAGAGVHAWMFRIARQLHAHMPAGEIVRLLEGKTAQCGRHVPQREIIAAVTDALSCAWQPTGQATLKPGVSKWPTVNQGQREAIVRDGGGLVDLWEASPVRIEDSTSKTESVIDALFPGNPLLCCGESSSKFATAPREDWRGQLSGLSLIVPSPMSALEGRKKNPKPGENPMSAHTLDNTGPRRFLICEFDQGTTDEHAAILLHLAKYAPLVLAVHSGGKSLHGWFYVAPWPEERHLKFFRYAVSLGADPATWTRSQFVRMPDGTRDNGKRQTVFFFNPQPTQEES